MKLMNKTGRVGASVKEVLVTLLMQGIPTLSASLDSQHFSAAGAGQEGLDVAAGEELFHFTVGQGGVGKRLLAGVARSEHGQAFEPPPGFGAGRDMRFAQNREQHAIGLEVGMESLNQRWQHLMREQVQQAPAANGRK